MKHTISMASIALFVAVLTGCAAAAPSATPTPTQPAPTASADVTPQTVRIGSLKGPTTMGLVGLMDQADRGLAVHDYEVEVYGTADQVVPLMVQGNLDIALIPANLAAVLYQRTVGTDAQIEVLAINTLGVLTIVETGEAINSMEDLRGRTIYSTGKGTTPEHVLNYLLSENGLTPGVDVTVEFKSEATEVAAVLAADPAAIGVLPQPYVTVLMGANPDVRVALDLTEEWDAVATDSQLVTGVVVVRRAFAAEHPAVVTQFLADYRASTEFVNTLPTNAAPLIVAVGIAPNAAIAETAIPACNIVYIDGAQMRRMLEGYLGVLHAADPESVGGSVPGDDFYYSD
ncbi:MAG: sulfonate/nitrate/taurine transporter substrate-binding protein [Actinobacteria bacterium HGW-Actinobacteria-4]|nr:MAG: sulfonate/nitrate/taurine transporter substrate-binding protein [Actinobacteria bacterium HGW-Actinobacteria-4]